MKRLLVLFAQWFERFGGYQRRSALVAASHATAQAHVLGRLQAGHPVDAALLTFFPGIVKRMRLQTVTPENLELIASGLPSALGAALVPGCQCWPVYTNGQRGVMVSWPYGRGAVAYEKASRRGRQWGQVHSGYFHAGFDCPVLVVDRLASSRSTLVYDEFGRPFPGRYFAPARGTGYVAWKVGALTVRFSPQLGRAAVWAPGRAPLVGRWDAENQHVLLELGDQTLRLDSYGRLADQYGVAICSHLSTVLRLRRQAPAAATSSGFAPVLKAGSATLRARMHRPVAEPVEEVAESGTSLVEIFAARPAAEATDEALAS